MVLSCIADTMDAMVRRDSSSVVQFYRLHCDSVDAWLSLCLSVSVCHFTGSRRAA